jgi:hypothetical protein
VTTGNGGELLLPAFATSDEDAGARYDEWRMRDPYPDIAPALLNSTDLLDYVAIAGMLYPFAVEPPDKWLKPASCALACAGEFLRYDIDPSSGEVLAEPVRGTVDPESPLRLLANSITFLHLETIFRIPVYVAARFNLAIREIHRGILVGTGPLVDPGFDGRLLIPLHNLTTNEYSVGFGEPLVWVEFTKLSRNSQVANGPPQSRTEAFIDIPDRKRRKPIDAYLRDANGGKPIASSIPREVFGAKAQVAANTKLVARTRTFSIAGALAVVALMATLFAATVGAFVYTLTYTDGRVIDQQRIGASVAGFRQDMKSICARLEHLDPKALPPTGC